MTAVSRRAGERRRKPDPWRAAFFGLAVAALAGGVAWALLGSSFLVVRSIEVTGPAAWRAEVRAAAGVSAGTPMIRVDPSAVARRVERIRQVQSARVTLSWPDTVAISITPRTAVFVVQSRHGYEVADSYGVVLGRAAARPVRLIALIQPGGITEPMHRDPAVLAAGAVVRTLPDWLRALVTSVRADGPTAVVLVLRGDIDVLWGSPGHAAAKASETAILLRTDAAYYDVSDPSVAVAGRAEQQGARAGRWHGPRPSGHSLQHT
jgi:cell division septal protein FtsQ